MASATPSCAGSDARVLGVRGDATPEANRISTPLWPGAVSLCHNETEPFTSSFFTEQSSHAIVTTNLVTQELSRVLVPEPGTAALLAAGLVWIGWRRRAATP